MYLEANLLEPVLTIKSEFCRPALISTKGIAYKIDGDAASGDIRQSRLTSAQQIIMEDFLTAEVDKFCTALRRRQIEGSMRTARKSTELIRLLLTTRRHADGHQLLEEVRSVGVTMQKAKPSGATNKQCSRQDLMLPYHLNYLCWYIYFQQGSSVQPSLIHIDQL